LGNGRSGKSACPNWRRNDCGGRRWLGFPSSGSGRVDEPEECGAGGREL